MRLAILPTGRAAMLIGLASLLLVCAAWGQDSTAGFQVGDRVLLRVDGESLYTDTFTVIRGPALRLPVIGDVPLAGVPRSGIEPYLVGRLGPFFKHPVIHACALVSIGVVGEVEHPGFYVVPGDALLTDVLMTAGGPTRDAKVTDLKVLRDKKAVLDGDRLQQAMASRRTVADLSLQAGDQLVVPRATRHDPESTWRIVSIIIGLPVAIFAITRLH
ncbi:MAG TPA: SLBB domain-containing protein [Gemmatimonadales bacterium]|nr:SLBB domain-containing protein [Gemmatimonadales bacterium]